MSRSGVDFAIRLAADEGWNPGLHDAAAFFDADPEGFLAGVLHGRPIGCISAVRYPENFGFIGLYIVVPEHRGKGYGIRLWEAGMQRLAGCNVGLDGVLAQQANYRKSGFALAYSNIRYERSGSLPPPSREASVGLVGAGAVPFDALAAFERTAFPSSREPFLRSWLRQPDSVALVATAGGAISGFGAIRKCLTGYKVGPLFAADAATADRLYLALCGEAVRSDQPVYLDVPEVNASAMALAAKYGMREVFGTARMYTGETPSIALDRVYGVTTFELG